MNLKQRLSWKAIPRKRGGGGGVVFCNMRCTHGLRNERGGLKTRDVGRPRQRTETAWRRTNREGGTNAAGCKSPTNNCRCSAAGRPPEITIPYWRNPNVTSLAAQMLSKKNHVRACEICTQTHLFTYLHDQEN